MKIIYSKFLTGRFEGKFYLFFIALKHKYVSNGLIRHELRHAEQYKANKWHFISQLWDMDIRTKLEVDAYVHDKRFCPEVISYIIHNLYELSILGKIIGKILGRRTHKYSKIEILELVKLKMKEQGE
jgi:hypothetical protein